MPSGRGSTEWPEIARPTSARQGPSSAETLRREIEPKLFRGPLQSLRPPKFFFCPGFVDQTCMGVMPPQCYFGQMDCLSQIPVTYEVSDHASTRRSYVADACIAPESFDSFVDWVLLLWVDIVGDKRLAQWWMVICSWQKMFRRKLLNFPNASERLERPLISHLPAPTPGHSAPSSILLRQSSIVRQLLSVFLPPNKASVLLCWA